MEVELVDVGNEKFAEMPSRLTVPSEDTPSIVPKVSTSAQGRFPPRGEKVAGRRSASNKRALPASAP
jgi:hypothetical protein